MQIKMIFIFSCGFAEKDKKEFYNSSVLVGPEGILGVYRKIHLNKDDRSWATEGNEWKYFDTKVGRVGLMIGYDAVFPESARCLGLYGCDVSFMLFCTTRCFYSWPCRQ